jgi:DNA-directed RNA polymerase specialized sigma24 family protein
MRHSPHLRKFTFEKMGNARLPAWLTSIASSVGVHIYRENEFQKEDEEEEYEESDDEEQEMLIEQEEVELSDME